MSVVDLPIENDGGVEVAAFVGATVLKLAKTKPTGLVGPKGEAVGPLAGGSEAVLEWAEGEVERMVEAGDLEGIVQPGEAPGDVSRETSGPQHTFETNDERRPLCAWTTDGTFCDYPQSEHPLEDLAWREVEGSIGPPVRAVPPLQEDVDAAVDAMRDREDAARDEAERFAPEPPDLEPAEVDREPPAGDDDAGHRGD